MTRFLTGSGLVILLVAIACLLTSVFFPVAAAVVGFSACAAALVRRSAWGRGWVAILIVGAIALVISLSMLLLSFDVNAGR